MKQALTRQEKRRAWLYAVIISAAILLVCAAVPAVIGWLRWQGSSDAPNESALLQAASQGLDEIAVEAVFDPENRRLDVLQTMTLMNRSGKTLDRVTLRSYSGAYLLQETSPAATEELFAASYGDTFVSGGLLVDAARVNGRPVEASFTDDARTVLTLPCGEWQPEASVTVTLACHVNIPLCQSRFGMHEGIWALGNVFPTPAVWLEGELRTDPYVSIGDPFLSECANWRVTLSLPEGYAAAATGYASAPVRSAQGMTLWQYEVHAVRDFALVISDRWQQASLLCGDTLVVALARDPAHARSMAEKAAQALESYGRRYGSYPYPTLTLCEVDFPFGGMEYPQLIMLGSNLWEDEAELVHTIAHEVAHQWWSVTVGSDSFLAPWQDEALAEYTTLDYYGDAQGFAMREEMRRQRIDAALRITVAGSLTPGSPIDYFGNLGDYGTVVYQRGAALFTALETHLGKDRMEGFLRAYAETFRFRIATRKDMEQLLLDYTGQDLSALFLDYLDTEINN